MAQLTLEHLSKRYGKTVALLPTDLTVENGEFLTLLGPSGCGKTTTLRIIAGFVEPDTGRIRVDGEDITHAPPRLRHIGMVFQDYALFPHMTVAENVAFGLRERGLQRRLVAPRVTEMLALVKLEEMADRLPAQLSGGQQQRVALARALAHPPRLLLMDEPFSALDARLREGLRTELRRIQQQLGITTIFITHDRQEAMAISDTIAVMREGRIEQRGTARALYDQPETRFVADFIGPVNFLELAAHRAAGLPLQLECGDETVIGVRPENIALLPPGVGNESGWRVRGRVLGSVYHGHLMHVAVDLGSTIWTVHLHARGVAPEGDVHLAWDETDTLRY